jgi:pilus assembly protein CpaF
MMKFKGREEETAEFSDKVPLTEALVGSAEDFASIVNKGSDHSQKERNSRGIEPYVMKTISDDVINRIDGSVATSISKEELLPQVEGLVSKAVDVHRFQLNEEEQKVIAGSIVDDMMGQGPLDALLDDEDISEIMVNGPKNIWVEKAGKTMLSDAKFRDEDHLLTIAKRMARFVGRRLDEQSPYVDARLQDGSRVNIISSPIALDGTSISIRKFPKGRYALSDLQRIGTLSSQMSEFIGCIAASRCNVIVSGGTSSGKTTILNTLGDFIRESERVITIEDSAELKIEIGNLVRLETRAGTAEAGSKAVTQRDLVANSLRMRPDRIILGEVRREEAFDLLQAMGTGHDGSMGTLHSNNPRDTCRRLENMILMGGFELPTRVIRSQIVSAVDFIIHAARGADGKRRVTNITEVTGLEGEIIALQDVFFFEPPDDKGFSGGDYVANPVSLRSAGKLKEYGHYEKAVEAILSSPRPRAKG